MSELPAPSVSGIRVNGNPPLGLAHFDLDFIAEDVGYQGDKPGTRVLDLLDEQFKVKGRADVLSAMTDYKEGKTYVTCRVRYFNTD